MPSTILCSFSIASREDMQSPSLCRQHRRRPAAGCTIRLRFPIAARTPCPMFHGVPRVQQPATVCASHNDIVPTPSTLIRHPAGRSWSPADLAVPEIGPPLCAIAGEVAAGLNASANDVLTRGITTRKPPAVASRGGRQRVTVRWWRLSRASFTIDVA